MDRLEIERRADGPPDLAGRGELLHAARERLRALVQRRQQARVLDGDDRLVGRRLEQLDAAGTEGPWRGVTRHDRPDRLPLAQHGHRERRAPSTGSRAISRVEATGSSSVSTSLI
jgi:hypothetical protein